MRKIVVGVLFVIGCQLPTIARGTLVSCADHHPIFDARIYMDESSPDPAGAQREAKTDSFGRFEMSVPTAHAARYQVLVDKPGFDRKLTMVGGAADSPMFCATPH
jgi:hypothetical protein